MPAPNTISPDKLARLIGTPAAPTLVDVRKMSKAGLIPGSVRRPAGAVSDWSLRLGTSAAIVIDEIGGPEAHGAAAWLRSDGITCDVLDGGFAAWTAAGQPTVRTDHLPPPAPDGRRLWVTRARPKVDRIACPWLIRRFVDPESRFLFVPAADVLAVAAGLGAEPFDVEGDGVFWSHRGERCTFDIMVDAFGLAELKPLARLAVIVRGADTARPDLAPQAAGLLAASLGLSRMFSDDLEQLEAGMLLYDSLYRWSRDAADETHDWVSHAPRRRKDA